MNERFKNLHGISDIVDAMIQGLKKEWVKVNMGTFGDKSYVGNKLICYGCAATNTICEIMQEPFTAMSIGNPSDRAEKFNYGITIDDYKFFEYAVDELRKGNIYGFYKYLTYIKYMFGFELPKYEDIDPIGVLPYMDDDDYKEFIPDYEKYRDWLKKKGL